MADVGAVMACLCTVWIHVGAPPLSGPSAAGQSSPRMLGKGLFRHHVGPPRTAELGKKKGGQRPWLVPGHVACRLPPCVRQGRVRFGARTLGLGRSGAPLAPQARPPPWPRVPGSATPTRRGRRRRVRTVCARRSQKERARFGASPSRGGYRSWRTATLARARSPSGACF